MNSFWNGAEAYIHSKSRQHGSLRLKQALAQQGIDETLSREFMPDKARELQTAVAVLRKKFKQPAADLKDKQKQARFLAYRGFDMDTIHRYSFLCPNLLQSFWPIFHYRR